MPKGPGHLHLRTCSFQGTLDVGGSEFALRGFGSWIVIAAREI
jgi:hypothetical protein